MQLIWFINKALLRFPCWTRTISRGQAGIILSRQAFKKTRLIMFVHNKSWTQNKRNPREKKKKLWNFLLWITHLAEVLIYIRRFYSLVKKKQDCVGLCFQSVDGWNSISMLMTKAGRQLLLDLWFSGYLCWTCISLDIFVWVKTKVKPLFEGFTGWTCNSLGICVNGCLFPKKHTEWSSHLTEPKLLNNNLLPNSCCRSQICSIQRV